MKRFFAIIFVITSTLLFTACSSNPTEELIDNPDQLDTIVKVPQLLYGFPIDSFKVVGDQVKKNQFFSDLVTSYGVDYGVMNKMAHEGKKVFDVRRLRAGRNYTVFLKNDSTEQPQIFVFEKNMVEYIAVS